MQRTLLPTIVILLASLLAACGAPQPAQPVLPTATPAPASPTTAPTPTEGGRGLGTPVPRIGEEAVSFLTEQVDVAGEALEVVSVESVTWNDASLGCPEPDKVYAQVVTPGYRVVLRGPDGTEYEVHTDNAGDTMVRCTPEQLERGRDLDTGDLDALPVEEVVRIKLADALGVEPGTLTLQSKEETEWSSAALGCPEPGKEYAAVVIPGFELVYESSDSTAYTVHTDETGQQWVRCEDGTPAQERTTRGGDMTETLPSIPDSAQPAYKKALSLAMDVSGADQDAISLQEWEHKQWRDSSLGCPKEGMAYTQVITPGYRFVFDAGGTTYEIHTNDTGSSAVLCNDK